jgi:hypothetical protein
MSFTPDELRAYRAYLSQAGACHRCKRPAEGYFCLACKRSTAERAKVQMQRSRLTKAFLVIWSVLLPANLCVSCQQPKDKFHPWYCAKCRKKAA